MNRRHGYYICTLCDFVVGDAEFDRDEGTCRCCGQARLEPVMHIAGVAAAMPSRAAPVANIKAPVASHASLVA